MTSFNPRTANGKTIWYVFIDESGVPYKQEKLPFTIGAIVCNDPEAMARIALSEPSETLKDSTKDLDPAKPGYGEVKHSTSSPEVIDETLQKIRTLHKSKPDSRKKLKIRTYRFTVTKTPERAKTEDERLIASDYRSYVYELLVYIAREGPPGIYKIRIDNSPYYDQSVFEELVYSAFKDSQGKELAKTFILPVDSQITPALQVTDVLVGASRDSSKKGETSFNEFNEHNRVKSFNEKGWRGVNPRHGTGTLQSSEPRKAQCRSRLLPFKAGSTDSDGRTANTPLHPRHEGHGSSPDPSPNSRRGPDCPLTSREGHRHIKKQSSRGRRSGSNRA